MKHRYGSLFKKMMDEVVAAGKCSGCASCVLVCPYSVLQYGDQKPVQGSKPNLGQNYCPVDSSIGCAACAMVCTRLNEAHDSTPKPQLDAKSRDIRGDFGPYRLIMAARTTNSEIAKVCQDGGAVTSILAWAIEKKLIDGAAVSAIASDDKPCFPQPYLAKSVEDLKRCAGSWYTYSANPLALFEAWGIGLKKVAVVGLPCQISGLKYMELAAKNLKGRFSDELSPKGLKHLKRMSQFMSSPLESTALTIGLFCSETFTYEGLMLEKIGRELGISLEDIEKINIKGKLIIQQKSGATKEVPLGEIKKYSRRQCSHCPDFSAEAADISAGGVGTRGWTIVVARTERGESFLKGASRDGYLELKPISEFEKSLKTLEKLSALQKKRPFAKGQRL